jgi:hypothetical protein
MSGTVALYFSVSARNGPARSHDVGIKWSNRENISGRSTRLQPLFEERVQMSEPAPMKSVT